MPHSPLSRSLPHSLCITRAAWGMRGISLLEISWATAAGKQTLAVGCFVLWSLAWFFVRVSSERKKQAWGIIRFPKPENQNFLTTDNNKTDSWSECRTGSENVNNRLASNKCDNSQSFLIKIFFERFWKVGLKANIVRLIHNYKWKIFFNTKI